VIIDPGPYLVYMIRGVVESDTDEPWMQFRFGAEQADPLLLGAWQATSHGSAKPVPCISNVRADSYQSGISRRC